MSDTDFTAKVTRIRADWLNDLNQLRYGNSSLLRGAQLLEFMPTGPAAVARSVREELDDMQVVSSLRKMSEVQRNDVLGRVGSMDVSGKIQEVVDYAQTKGCTIEAVPGIYFMGNTVTVNSHNTCIRGRGLNTVFRRTGDYGDTFLFTGDNANGTYLLRCGLEDVAVQALGLMTSGVHVNLNGVQWFSLKNVQTLDGFTCFRFAGVLMSFMRGLHSHRVALYGGSVTGRKGILFDGATGNYAHPSCSDLFISQMNVKGIHGVGIDPCVEDCIYVTCADGIWIQDGHTAGGKNSDVTFSAEHATEWIGTVQLDGVMCDPTKGAGIRFKGSTQQIFGCQITKSNIHGASGQYGETCGILVDAGTDMQDCEFTNCNVYDWGQEGVKALAGESITFTTLTCRDNSKASVGAKSGIYLENTDDYRFVGGLSGFDRPFSGTRTQKYGIEFGASNNDCVMDGGFDLQGNISGSIGGGAGQYRTGNVALEKTPSAAILGNLVKGGGKKFNGTTDYLDSNALTGIAASKKFTFAWKGRFANASGSQEAILHSAGIVIRITREANGTMQIVGENAAGVQILSQTSTGTAAAPTAGDYTILISLDLGTAGSMRFYVNDIQNLVNTTFTDDSIGFSTVTEYSVGAQAAGAIKFTGDMYLVGFLEGVYIDFNTKANRRKFFDRAGNIADIGPGGENAFGAQARLLLYGRDYPEWPMNLGSGTGTFTINGTPAAPTVASYEYEEAVQRSVTVTTATHTVGTTITSLVGDRAAGTITLTLDVTVETVAREIRVRTVQNQTIISAASNVVPLAGGAAGTAICAGTAGKWALLRKSIGSTTYQIIEGN